MAAAKKLQAEIDKHLKKVNEGVETYDELWQELHDYNHNQAHHREAETLAEEGKKEQLKRKKQCKKFTSAENRDVQLMHFRKEKFVQELEKEIKKLHRLGDQVKTWLKQADIKDKSELNRAKKNIELRYKRGKEFYKDGESSEPKAGDVSLFQQQEQENFEFIHESMQTLREQLDAMDAEMEMISKQKKPNEDRRAMLEGMTDGHKWHIKKMERLLRHLTNFDIDHDTFESIKAGIEYYVDENQNEDFCGIDQYLYDELGLEDMDGEDLGVESEEEAPPPVPPKKEEPVPPPKPKEAPKPQPSPKKEVVPAPAPALTKRQEKEKQKQQKAAAEKLAARLSTTLMEQVAAAPVTEDPPPASLPVQTRAPPADEGSAWGQNAARGQPAAVPMAAAPLVTPGSNANSAGDQPPLPAASRAVPSRAKKGSEKDKDRQRKESDTAAGSTDATETPVPEPVTVSRPHDPTDTSKELQVDVGEQVHVIQASGVWSYVVKAVDTAQKGWVPSFTVKAAVQSGSLFEPVEAAAGYKGDEVSTHLSVEKGENIFILEKAKTGWCYGYVSAEPRRRGWLPSCVVVPRRSRKC
mmetsp:Transcript_28732/g.65240  ORF Transcript_28732/g.65240 Transcript_28732/m.65240 type:complete len:581 (-) Transcript_28732:168-1910(-)